MKRQSCLRIATTAIASIALAVLSTASSGADDSRIINTPGHALAWSKTAEGVAFAALVGNRFTQPYMAMVRLPAGLVSPAHTKSANMFGVVVSGVMIHRRAGADPRKDVRLPPGSFYKIPKGLAHVSLCVSPKPCVTFLYQDGKFDFRPVTP